MTHAALERLLAQARALPGDRAPAGLPRAADRADVAPAPVPPFEAAALRARVGAALTALAARLEEALPRALALAASAWDQVDALTVVDADLGAELATLRGAARALAGAADLAAHAAGREAELTLDAAVGLVTLLERRLATLVRLRMRATDATLLDPAGRPFLDVAAALAEAARAWA